MMYKSRSRFPKATHFLDSLEHGHPAHCYPDNSFFLREIEFLLSLEQQVGFDGKIKELTSLHGANRIGQNVQWFSLRAELGAIYVVGSELKLPINGFEQQSPNAPQVSNNQEAKTCDFRALLCGVPLFFEVKAKSSEEIQRAPKQIIEYLSSLAWFCSSESCVRKWKLNEVEEEVQGLRKYVRPFQQSHAKEAPPEYSSSKLTV